MQPGIWCVSLHWADGIGYLQCVNFPVGLIDDNLLHKAATKLKQKFGLVDFVIDFLFAATPG